VHVLHERPVLISLCDPTIGEAEKKALCDVIDSQWLTMGDRVAEFEKAFAGLHDMDDAVAEKDRGVRRTEGSPIKGRVKRKNTSPLQKKHFFSLDP